MDEHESPPYLTIEPQKEWHGDAGLHLNRYGAEKLMAALRAMLDSEDYDSNHMFYAGDGDAYWLELVIHPDGDVPAPKYPAAEGL